MNQKVVVWRLRKFGNEPTVVASGEEAVQAAAGKDFDLILMDVRMPDMDGYEATRQIREHEAANGRPRSYIAAMTALVMDNDLEACREAGMDGFLPKPMRVEDLESILDQADRPAN